MSTTWWRPEVIRIGRTYRGTYTDTALIYSCLVVPVVGPQSHSRLTYTYCSIAMDFQSKTEEDNDCKTTKNYHSQHHIEPSKTKTASDKNTSTDN